ncbi:acetylornithine deacetylase [Labrys sp. KNU-23]|uniref:acetylornithine deacetylase n=1 Tax=Labrys sp. KNU-23 TaxID=2789216 RepID=UPI0011EBAE13|nr:acetylornithine deacetylase [Labrys sp. KNU-23]QEN86255.1 acetylornithine deacetylase [Labrys sp. KNU-23]
MASEPTTLDILARLIGFATLSRQSNRELIGYVTGLLDGAGIGWDLVESPDGTRANLFATVGPAIDGGVVLSGHTDVVPVEGQAWSTDPFRLHEQNGRYYGRGSADMKGFVAAALAAALQAARYELKTPLHLAFSYDEEIGCVGVRSLIDRLSSHPIRPALCIVGEPTGMRIATGHKGKVALRACCTGRAGHSALAPTALNALHLGADFLGRLRERQRLLAETGRRDEQYEIPYTTLHAGRMSGGQALNIVPECCEVEFEIRNVVGDDPQAIIAGLKEDAETIIAPLRPAFPEAAIAIDQVNAYPGLETPLDSPVVALLRLITESRDPAFKVAFGTEGGLFQDRLGLATAVCGPGFMAQGHKADEYVGADQLGRCDAMLAALVDRLAAGL